MERLPRRRKSRDNPYTIIHEDNKYYIIFKDSKKNQQKVELDYQLYVLFNEFELEDISQMHKYNKHIEHSEIYDENLYKRAITKPISIEEQVNEINNKQLLKNTIRKLPNIQKKRLVLYYYKNKSLKEISLIEKCSFQAVSKNILMAKKNIKKMIYNNKYI